MRLCRYTYNDLGELKVNSAGNTNTEYSRHKNGLVSQVTITLDVTKPNILEITTYQYDPRGQLTSEGRIDSHSLQTRFISYDNQGRLASVEDQNTSPAGPICDVHYSYDEWSYVRRIEATYSQTTADTPQPSDEWYDYDAAGRMTVSNGTMSNGAISLLATGNVRISYDSVGRRSETTEYV